MREAPPAEAGTPTLPRIIPADAGSTGWVPTLSIGWRDHPRGCGEHQFSAYPIDKMLGSSPRMRGAHCDCMYLCFEHRIIPADAGSTGCRAGRWSWSEDHPRGCGEHHSQLPPLGSASGSSPRMRGAHNLTSLIIQHARIIPADAGSTCSLIGNGPVVWDHPRGCGEHSGRGAWVVCRWGSSPRMRGALADAYKDIYYRGIIPADAGSTAPLSTWWCADWDHPRGCGEHCNICSPTRNAPGSSPRMRGAPFRADETM